MTLVALGLIYEIYARVSRLHRHRISFRHQNITEFWNHQFSCRGEGQPPSPSPIPRTRKLVIPKFSEDDLAIVSKLEIKNGLSVSVISAPRLHTSEFTDR